MDLAKITHFLYWLFSAKSSGLDKTPADDRDFQVGIFGWGEYVPKHTRLELPTLSTKDQGSFNTCQWNATITAKEPDEGVKLSVRKLVTWGKRNGYVSGNGFSNLRSGQLALQKYGSEPEMAQEVNWNWAEYSNAPLNTEAASQHKISSFWSVSSRNDILKLLDEGHRLTTGIDWYTGFNQGGGFSDPWIISKRVGYSVGGHAVTIIGYDLNYYGKKVYMIKNSYGKEWGDNGKFYIEMGFLEGDNYGIFVNLDIAVDTGAFIAQYDGKNVKGRKSSTIYFIQNGKKKPYLHEMDYFVYNINDSLMKNFEVVDDAILAKVPVGDKMDIRKSLYWPALERLEQPLNLTRVLDAIRQGQPQI